MPLKYKQARCRHDSLKKDCRPCPVHGNAALKGKCGECKKAKKG